MACGAMYAAAWDASALPWPPLPKRTAWLFALIVPWPRSLYIYGRAEGVRLENGEELRAAAVLSNAEPKRTFMQFCADAHLDKGFLKRISQFKTDSAVIKLNVALKELPSFKCLPGTTPGLQHAGSCEISPTPDWVQEAYEDAAHGELSKKPYIEAYMQSATDPTVAPAGTHTISMVRS